MLPKEKLKVTLLVLGFSVGFFGAFVMLPPHPKEEGRKTYEKGMFADAAAAGALESYGPWMLGISGLAFLGAYLLRDK